MLTRQSLDDRPDAELVEAARAGDAAAFEALYRRHSGGVRRALAGRLGDVERQLDLVQETFTRALTKLSSLREAGQFRPWLLQIARNAAADDLRGRLRHRIEPLDEEPPGDAGDPALVAEVGSLAAAITIGLATLSPRDAAAVSMAAHLGFGPREIAAALGISHSNAKVIVHRARRRLRAAAGLERLDVVDEWPSANRVPTRTEPV